VVDCVDSRTQARWWGSVYAATVVDDERGFSSVARIPGMGSLSMDFIPVPEPKTVKNRVAPGSRCRHLGTGTRSRYRPRADPGHQRSDGRAEHDEDGGGHDLGVQVAIRGER